jgi:hypothetical protein
MMNEFDKAYEEYYGTLGSQKDFCRIIWNAAIEKAKSKIGQEIQASEWIELSLEELRVETRK